MNLHLDDAKLVNCPITQAVIEFYVKATDTVYDNWYTLIGVAPSKQDISNLIIEEAISYYSDMYDIGDISFLETLYLTLEEEYLDTILEEKRNQQNTAFYTYKNASNKERNDFKWRLHNIYYIVDRRSSKMLFTPRLAQQILLDNLHNKIIILKSRQMGITTFFTLLGLDQCIFNEHFKYALITQGKKESVEAFKKILFAFAKIPPQIQEQVSRTNDSKDTVELSNGSSANVSVSTRSGTVNFLHISEYAITDYKSPKKREEIDTGALPSVAKDQMIVIESTNKGHQGQFYKRVTTAIPYQSDMPIGRMDYKLFFFPWFIEKDYFDDESCILTDNEIRYKDKVESYYDFKLQDNQWNWYFKTYRTQKDKMFEEFPSTKEEPFTSSVQGAFYEEEMIIATEQGRIGHFKYNPNLPVYFGWDLGMNDLTVIITGQWDAMANKWYIIDSFAGQDKGYEYYVKYLIDRPYNFKGCKNLLPHDIAVREQSTGEGRILKLFNTVVPNAKGNYTKLSNLIQVPRIPNKISEIGLMRQEFEKFHIDESGCGSLVLALRNYRRVWYEDKKVYSDEAIHDVHSHYCDAFAQLVRGKNLTNVFNPADIGRMTPYNR